MTRTITITIDLESDRPISATWDPAGYPESYHLWIERVDPADFDGHPFRIADDGDSDSPTFATLDDARYSFFVLVDDQVMLDIERLTTQQKGPTP